MTGAQVQQWHDNPTSFSDEMFRSFTPIILIRHPALTYPSFYTKQKIMFCDEADDEQFEVMGSLCWARMIFDCYERLYERGEAQARPIVVDAYDVVNTTDVLIPALCSRLGIDPAGVQYQWEPTPKDQWPADPCMQEFYKEILTSKSVQRGTDAVSGMTPSITMLKSES